MQKKYAGGLTEIGDFLHVQGYCENEILDSAIICLPSNPSLSLTCCMNLANYYISVYFLICKIGMMLMIP